jgi:DNA-directed RNA polymerase specialized sigma subunit, sigma24 homolog
MPFTASDLRYRAEQSYPLLYAYLHRNAQRFLGALKYDAFEVDTVIGHVVEQLVRLGLLGGEDHTPQTALDRLTDAQFYAFLNHSVRNKAIDRLRKRRLQVSAATELEGGDEEENENNPLDEAVESIWGATPFSTPEAITLHLVSQHDLRNILKHCIFVLSAAPNQLQAVMQELHDIGADDLLSAVIAELHVTLPEELNPHSSQHKDHAHKKLRACLQKKSSNLTVRIAVRITMYTERSSDKTMYAADIHTLAQDDLSLPDVRSGLEGLVHEGMLDWKGEEIVSLTPAQLKRLSRFYRDNEEE